MREGCHNHRRRTMTGALLLLLPLLFPSLFTPFSHAFPSLLSELNAPNPRHSRLLRSALERQTSAEQQTELWRPSPIQGSKPCLRQDSTLSLPEKSQGYIQVFLDGGLNQQRMGICDAVALAKILNATLIIPHLEVNPVWKDSSTFDEIFDYYAAAIRANRVKTAPVHASANWCLDNVSPVLQSYGIAAVAPFSHRLAFDNMPKYIQRLRCKVNFQALVFVPHIRDLGDSLVSCLRYPLNTNEAGSSNYLTRVTDSKDKQGSGKFVVLHLRFDKDMAAHSACDFGGGKAEKLALAKYRQVIWQGRVLNSQFTDEELRSQGRCPLTPEEIGLLLAALGFDNNTRLYLASHKVYGGEARISTLRSLFPLMEDKKCLASSDERAQIKGKSSLLAAVDYYVSMHSDIFISASPGNMHNAVVGHRTYENMKTIRPNMALLGQLFLNKSLTWVEFQEAVVEGHKSRQGLLRLRRSQQSIYTYPTPDCMCSA
ncbi:O-fucosyltransferase 31 [Salvia divinorum]|uniref:O-fucosyltransferase family protein n=1 Tax=Salvia divinorum TaxID=28513 RepID=A0ABD1FY42_SALDI